MLALLPRAATTRNTDDSTSPCEVDFYYDQIEIIAKIIWML